MKRLVIIASCLLGVAAAADWYWLNPLPTANNLNAVWFTGDTGYACGPTTIKTTDGGANWTTLATREFENIQFPVDGHTGYATGYGINKTTDGGATWTYVKIGDYKYTHDVCFPDGNDTGYATYDMDPPSIAKTCDGFATHTEMRFDNLARAFGMAFTDTRHGWIVGGGAGGGGGFIIRTPDGGATWTRQDSSHVMGRRRSISALADGQTAFVCGYEPSLQKTTDGGVHWDTLPFPAVDEALRVSFPGGPDTGFVIAELYGGNHVYRTTDGGQTWDTLPGTQYANAMHFPSGTRVGVAVGLSGTLVKTTDAGANWTSLTRYVSGTDLNTWLNDVDFPSDEATGYVVGNRGAYLKTTDGGQNWSRPCVFDTLADLYAVAAASADTLFIAGTGSYQNGRIWRSTDGGANWDTVFALSGSMPCDVEFPRGPDTGFVTDRARCVWRTTNGGDTWTRHSTLGTYLNAADFPSSLVGYAVGEGGTVNKTTDAGETWTDVSTSLQVDWYDVEFPVGADTGWVCGMSGCICRTTDGGATWEDQNVPTQSYLWSIRFPAGTQTGFCCGEGVMLTTTDGGVTWLANPNLTTQDLWSMQFPVSVGTGYIVGSGGTILKTGYGGGIEESLKPQAASSKPAATIIRGVLFLSEAIGARRETRSELLDVSGRKVLDLRPGANDVSRIAPGVYFVRSVGLELSAVSCQKVVLAR